MAEADTQQTEDKQSSEQSTVLEVRDLTKIYGSDTVAVDDLSFEVKKDEFCVIIGPSGCGKSTTLHSIVGKLSPTEGQIFVEGKDVTETPTHQRDIGLVFQDFQLFPHLDAEENIRYGLQEIDIPKSEQIERVNQMMELMDITHLRDRKPEDLSAGQQQRVALARSLVLEPEILLLDEPLGDLDYKMQKRLESELLRIHTEFETTFVYITHDQNQAMRLGDQLVVLNDGKLEQSGKTHEVYNKPATAFTAAFVGDSNLFLGTLTEVSKDESVATIETEFGEFSLGTENLDSKPDRLIGEEIPFAVRPQFLELGPAKENTLECSIEDNIYQPGTGTLLILSTTGPGECKEIHYRTSEKIETDLDEVVVSFDPTDGILLEQTSVVPDIDLEKDILGE